VRVTESVCQEKATLSISVINLKEIEYREAQLPYRIIYTEHDFDYEYTTCIIAAHQCMQYLTKMSLKVYQL
jgi:hypothetical protein